MRDSHGAGALRALRGFLVLGFVVLGAGCDCGGGPRPTRCTRASDCAAGEICVDGACTAALDGGLDAALDDAARDALIAPGDAGDLGPCDAAGLCQNDARCVGGRCIPWGPGGFDDTCSRAPVPGPVRPQLQCAWTGPPAGDPVPTYTHVLHTPLVADLGIETAPDVPTRPAIVFIADATYTEGPPRTCSAAGVLRAIDGATCRDLGAALDPADRVNAPVTPAIGDLDLDGRPEVVAAAADGGVIAFSWNATTRAFERLWLSHHPDGSEDRLGSTRCLWGAITLADLDDDGRPEVLFEDGVWAADGTRLATIPGWFFSVWGTPVPVADVDGDGRAEAMGGEGTWEWDPSTDTFVLESYFTPGAGARGFTAIADFGDFPGRAGDAVGRPEVVVVQAGTVYLQSLGGDLVWSRAGGTVGGPPTIADYDGDGRPEIGVAFGDQYTVFDPGDDRVLWSQPSQDLSSARTGSSVFDFNADDRAEVVYADECYVRVYDGPSGEVLFSQARFSSTWEENPIVADVDGDSAAEIVVSLSNDCQPAYCPTVDPIFAGLRCDVAGDCPGGTCDAGFCRCATDADCGATYGCSAPLAGTPGTGDVCRAFHRDCVAGIRVYRDARDRWAASRPIWNQHAYAVTNVEDDGTIPRTSVARENWLEPGLNNFRQNVQGDATAVPGPDLTIGNLTAFCGAADGTTELSADVCNRGAALNDAGVEVIFRQVGGAELCRLRTTEPVPPGICTTVSCTAPVLADGVFEAVVDPDAIIGECIEGDNLATGEADCVL